MFPIAERPTVYRARVPVFQLPDLNLTASAPTALLARLPEVATILRGYRKSVAVPPV